jgi:leucyl-tRNA synthetase
MSERRDLNAPNDRERPDRYDADQANRIEAKWQGYWKEKGTFTTPNPGEPGFDASKPKQYVLDMFPFPSGAGLHVGHPRGYIATDVYARYLRMIGCNVLHTMGFDAFGLPAEQYAIETGTHPRTTTENNVNSIRGQLEKIGLAHDPHRRIATTDVPYVRWTQWIFLQIFNSWYDERLNRARPIGELTAELERGERKLEGDARFAGRNWSDLSALERRQAIDGHRLAYLDNITVNWCPALGTVLANEEVTADGRSERGDHPVFKRPLKQWMLRITTYAERLINDLDRVDWPEPTKAMQRNWVGRSEGATVRFTVADDPPGGAHPATILVFTTRPDTLFGATYMVLAPEHPLVDEITGADHREAVTAYREAASRKSDLDRTEVAKQKTGVFTGAHAVNPVNNEKIPIWIADYVMASYGTGAIMAVPAHDERDFEFARQFGLAIKVVVTPTGENSETGAFTRFDEDSVVVNSSSLALSLNGLSSPAAKRKMIDWLTERGLGARKVSYKLRDWLFSRQRYWGEPFPIVYDEHDLPVAIPESLLPVTLPDLQDFAPESNADPAAPPRPPLSRAADWVHVQLDLGDGLKIYRREVNTMPQWAGSCWYYLRYLDPDNSRALCDPAIERYWMLGTPAQQAGGKERAGGVDLYVGGVEHAVLHLLYARFWHKILEDLGHVSTPEPFQKLYNQGYVLAAAYRDRRGVYVPAEEVDERDGAFFYKGESVERQWGKMGKSLKNGVSPDEICREYGCDTLRMYEMAMGPLNASQPWNPRDIVGLFRFLGRLWRNVIDESTGKTRATPEPADADTRRLVAVTIDAVRRDIERLSFNTAIAKLIELNNALTGSETLPMTVARDLVLLVAPFAPHIAEELWQRLGNEGSLAYHPYPVADERLLQADSVDVPVAISGKVRASVAMPPETSRDDAEKIARQDPKVQGLLEGKSVMKVIFVPGKMLNFVVGR